MENSGNRRLEADTGHTSRQHVREEREAEEDNYEDEVAKAADGIGPITADYEWKEVGVELNQQVSTCNGTHRHRRTSG